MNIITWNCHGTTARGFSVLIKDLVKYNNSSFLILLETHTSGDKAISIIHKFGLHGSFIQDATGHWGGICCVWQLDDWTMKVLRNMT